MNSNIEEIYNSFKKRNRNLLFPVKYLDEIPLDDKRRLDIEKKIVKFCLKGDTASFIYIDHLKLINIAEAFSVENISKLSIYNQASILKILYNKTHDISYLNNIINLSLKDVETFNMLCYLYNDLNNEELKASLKKCLLQVCDNVGDSKYFDIYDRIIENKKDKINYEVVKSMLYGFAVGDALGVPYEFLPRQQMQIKPARGMSEYGTHNQPKGTWSDDTSMTIAAMDSIAECNGNVDYEDIMNKYCEWWREANYTATGLVFDMGISTRTALNKYKTMNEYPTECGGKDVRSNGNGSLMRMIPLVAFLNEKEYTRQGSLAMINNYSSLTHGHDISILGCLIYYDYMSCLLNGMSCLEAYNSIIKNNYEVYFSPDVVNAYRDILDGNLLAKKKEEINSSGYVVNTLIASMWCVLKTNSFEEAVLTAVNLGQDTDTVAAIAGSMAGLIYGYDNIPKEYIDDLKRIDLLDTISKNFVKSIKTQQRVSGHYDDMNPLSDEEISVLRSK